MEEFELDELGKPAKAPKITTNLFSFKTFRSPDKISYNEKKQFFIYYPETLEQGRFNLDLLLNKNESNKSQIDTFINNLKPLKNYREVRALDTNFYDYSCLLMEQRRNDSSRPPFDVTPPPGAPEWVKKNNPRFPKTIINYQYKNEKGKYGTIDFNLIAEQDMVDVISYLVNGGSTGLQERRDYVQSLKKIMKYDECANK